MSIEFGFSHHPKWVQLKQSNHTDNFADTVMETSAMGSKNVPTSTDIDSFAGIYLPIEAGLSDTSMLILPKMHFRANTHFNVSIDGEKQQVLLEDPIESRDDWVKVIFPF